MWRHHNGTCIWKIYYIFHREILGYIYISFEMLDQKALKDFSDM